MNTTQRSTHRQARRYPGRASALSTTAPCRLLPSDDGWSLLGPDNRLLHRGLGQDSRRECLQIARGLGVLTVLN